MTKARTLADFDPTAIPTSSITNLVQGITLVDTWVMTANQTITAGQATMNFPWSRETQDGFSNIGTMTESNGVFSFPSTGVYRVDAHICFEATAASDRMGIQIHVTTDNSTYDVRTEQVNSCSTNGHKISAMTSAIVDVTNINNVKVKPVYYASTSGSNATIFGSATLARTFVQFTRLADT